MSEIDYDCPYFKAKCSKKRAKCPKWVHILGVNSNTGQEVDQFDCQDHWGPVMQMELANKINQLGASIDKMATVQYNGTGTIINLLAQSLGIDVRVTNHPEGKPTYVIRKNGAP